MSSSFSGSVERVDSGRGVRLFNSRHRSVQIVAKWGARNLSVRRARHVLAEDQESRVQPDGRALRTVRREALGGMAHSQKESRGAHLGASLDIFDSHDHADPLESQQGEAMRSEEAKTVADFLLSTLEGEIPITTSVFGAVPGDKLDYRPDNVSKTALGLLRHVTLELQASARPLAISAENAVRTGVYRSDP